MSEELQELRERNERLTLLHDISNVIHATLEARITRTASQRMR